jgi:hypothetical protein
VLARVIEPSSKLDSLRVLDEAGIDPPSYPTLTRRLPIFATEAWRQALGGGVRGARRAGSGEPGALRRVRGDVREGGSSPDKAVSRQHCGMA